MSKRKGDELENENLSKKAKTAIDKNKYSGNLLHYFVNELSYEDSVQNSQDKQYRTVLIRLLENCNINELDENGDTPLHIAARNFNIFFFQTLFSINIIKNTPDFNIKNKEGKTPLDILQDKKVNSENKFKPLIAMIISLIDNNKSYSYFEQSGDNLRIQNYAEINNKLMEIIYKWSNDNIIDSYHIGLLSSYLTNKIELETFESVRQSEMLDLLNYSSENDLINKIEFLEDENEINSNYPLIFDVLKNAKSLTHLKNISYDNFLSEEFLSSFKECFKNSKKIDNIILQLDILLEESTEALNVLNELNYLKKLYLYLYTSDEVDENIENFSFKVLQSLKHNSSLKTLKIDMSDAIEGPYDCPNFFNGLDDLLQNNKNIENFKIKFEPYRDETSTYLFKVLKSAKYLKSIDLEVKNVDFDALADFIINSKTLTKLCVIHHQLTPENLLKLADAISKNSSLKSVKINVNQNYEEFNNLEYLDNLKQKLSKNESITTYKIISSNTSLTVSDSLIKSFNEVMINNREIEKSINWYATFVKRAKEGKGGSENPLNQLPEEIHSTILSYAPTEKCYRNACKKASIQPLNKSQSK